MLQVESGAKIGFDDRRGGRWKQVKVKSGGGPGDHRLFDKHLEVPFRDVGVEVFLTVLSTSGYPHHPRTKTGYMSQCNDESVCGR